MAKYNLLKVTLWKHLMGKVTGKGHHSRVKGCPKVLSASEKTVVYLFQHHCPLSLNFTFPKCNKMFPDFTCRRWKEPGRPSCDFFPDQASLCPETNYIVLLGNMYTLISFQDSPHQREKQGTNGWKVSCAGTLYWNLKRQKIHQSIALCVPTLWLLKISSPSTRRSAQNIR